MMFRQFTSVLTSLGSKYLNSEEPALRFSLNWNLFGSWNSFWKISVPRADFIASRLLESASINYNKRPTQPIQILVPQESTIMSSADYLLLGTADVPAGRHYSVHLGKTMPLTISFSQKFPHISPFPGKVLCAINKLHNAQQWPPGSLGNSHPPTPIQCQRFLVQNWGPELSFSVASYKLICTKDAIVPKDARQGL